MEETRYSILYVDDEESNLRIFKSAFKWYYDIHTATGGDAGLEILNRQGIDLVITDQRMPGMTGVQFLEQVVAEYPDTVRMILTGFTDVDSIIQAINSGRVYQYITKPWNQDELKITIDKALDAYQLRKENKNLLANLRQANQEMASYANQLEEKVKQRTREIEEKNEALARAHYQIELRNRDLETQVSERTINLEKSNQELTKANEELDMFIYRASHDLKGPVATLIGLVNSAKLDLDDPQALDYLTKIGRTTSVLNKTLNKLLTVNVINHNCNSMVKIFSRDFFAEIKDDFGPALEKYGITFLMDTQELEHFQSDYTMLKIILENVVENAIAFRSERRQPLVEVGARLDEA
ncbi:MAG: response regulator, partial [Cytophagales bacterium]|nr:response regulator [Cytophagales bacterium]